MASRQPRSSAAFFVTAAAFLVTMAGTTMPTPLYQGYQAAFDFSVVTVTVIYAVYAAGVLASLLIAGRWSDAIGRKPMLIAGLAFAAVSDLVFLAAGDVAMLLIGRVLSGISAGLYVGAGTAAVVEAAPPAWQGRASLVATAVNIGGLGLGPLLAAVLVDTLPWPLHLTYGVHLGLAVLLLAALSRVPETVAVTPGARVRLAPPAGVPRQVRALFMAAAISSFAGFSVLGLLTALSPWLVAVALHTPSHVVQVSVAVTVFASSVVAQILLQRLAAGQAVILGTALLIVGCALLAIAIALTSYPVMLLAAVVSGAGQGIAFSRGLASVVMRTEPADRAGVASAFFIVAYVALSFPVIGAGLSLQRWGLVTGGVSFGLIVGLLAVVALALLLIEQRRAREGEAAAAAAGVAGVAGVAAAAPTTAAADAASVKPPGR